MYDEKDVLNRFLEEAHKFLKPSGCVVLILSNLAELLGLRAPMRQLFLKHGWTLVQEEQQALMTRLATKGLVLKQKQDEVLSCFLLRH